MILMSMCDISFVIPVYNGRKTILRCLESIYKLDLSKDRFEVIVIDDCSTDNTCDIVADFATLKNNLTLVRQTENHRQGAARNRGVRLAKGMYVMFVDADDTVESGIPKALDYVSNTPIDMLWCKWSLQSSPDGVFKEMEGSCPYDTILSGTSFCNQYYDMMIYGGPCTYLIRRAYINTLGIPFVEDRMMEDVDWVEKHLFHCSSFACYNTKIYSYFFNEGSTLHSFSAKRDADTLMYCIRRLYFAEQVESMANCFSDKVKQYAFGWINYVLSFRHLSRHSVRSINKIYKDIGEDSLSFLSRFKWPHTFTHFCITYPNLIVCLMGIIHPFCELARIMYRKILNAKN